MTGSYDPMLVIASYAISVFGSYTALKLAGRLVDMKDRSPLWLIGAAVALGGGGIWAMHFVAMLAFRLPIPVAYNVTLTLLSLLVAVVVTGIGFFTLSRRFMSRQRLILSGIIMGLGVGSMHYTGMAAMRLKAAMHHEPLIVALSLVIAVIASFAALWLTFNLRAQWQRIGGAFVMGAAVCGMHYTAMAGVHFVPMEQTAGFLSSAISVRDLAVYVLVTTVTVLGLALIALFSKELQEEG